MLCFFDDDISEALWRHFVDIPEISVLSLLGNSVHTLQVTTHIGKLMKINRQLMMAIVSELLYKYFVESLRPLFGITNRPEICIHKMALELTTTERSGRKHTILH